jgi:hypothetical protein
VNTLTCAVLIFIICFGYLRQFCCLVWYISGVLLIYPTKFEIYYFVMDPSMVTLDNKNEVRKYFSTYIFTNAVFITFVKNYVITRIIDIENDSKVPDLE